MCTQAWLGGEGVGRRVVKSVARRSFSRPHVGTVSGISHYGPRIWLVRIMSGGGVSRNTLPNPVQLPRYGAGCVGKTRRGGHAFEVTPESRRQKFAANLGGKITCVG